MRKPGFDTIVNSPGQFCSAPLQQHPPALLQFDCPVVTHQPSPALPASPAPAIRPLSARPGCLCVVCCAEQEGRTFRRILGNRQRDDPSTLAFHYEEIASMQVRRALVPCCFPGDFPRCCVWCILKDKLSCLARLWGASLLNQAPGQAPSCLLGWIHRLFHRAPGLSVPS